MLSFLRQFIDLTESSSSSTFFNRFLLYSGSEICGFFSTSLGSSKLTKSDNCSWKILAAKATASSAVTEPSVSTVITSLS